MSTFQRFYWSKKEVSTALEEISLVRNKSLVYFSKLMNEYHKEKHSLRYYDILAGNWIENFIHIIYSSILQKKINSSYEFKNSYVPISSDLKKFYRNIMMPFFHNHIQSTISKMLNNKFEIKDLRFNKKNYNISIGKKSDYKDFIRSFISSKDSSLYITSPYYKTSTFDFYSFIWKNRKLVKFEEFNFNLNFDCEIDQSWRVHNFVKYNNSKEFSDIIYTIMPLYVPLIFFEGFQNYKASILKKYNYRPASLYTANAFHSNMHYKILAATWSELGTKILIHQHGGVSGIDKDYPFEDYEIRISDIYFSWGWKKNNQRIIPLSAPNIAVKSSRKRFISLFCYDLPDEVYRINYQPMPGGGIEKMHQDTIEFIKKLDNKKNLIVRYPPYIWNSKYTVEVKKIVGEDKFDKNNDQFITFSQSKIAIHAFLGTSYLESLALNIPTLCFYQDNIYAFRDKAKKHINKLLEVKIFHTSPLSAVNFLNSNENNILDWWNSAEVQNAKNNFLKKFANFNKNWSKDWKDILLSSDILKKNN